MFTPHLFAGDDVPIMVKFNVDDGITSGLSPADADTVATAFASNGADLLLPSCGFVSRNGLYMLRGGAPLAAMIKSCSRLAMAVLLTVF